MITHYPTGPVAQMPRVKFLPDFAPGSVRRFIGTVGLILLSGCASHGNQSPEQETRPVRVFYGTDRAIASSDEAAIDYSAERGEINYGAIDLQIWQRDAEALETENDQRNNLLGPTATRMLFATGMPREEFLAALQDPMQPGRPGHVMLFVHGFKRDFRTAAENAAKLAEGIGFPGRTVFWSWPSQNSAGSYLTDLNSLQWSQRHLARFITDLVEHGGTTNLTLVAHSLGAQGLTQALFTNIGGARLRDWDVIDNLVLLAPDIDVAIFERDLVSAVSAADIPTTIYASANDWALITSSSVNGYPRAGDASEGVRSFAGVDTIDATRVASSGLGHSYYRRSLQVLADLRQLIVGRKSIEQRPGLTRHDSISGIYWKLE